VDVASGQSATLHFEGRAHVFSSYSTQGGWTGSTDFWFLDVRHVTLGGNDYTVWGANQYTGGPVEVKVWVGPNVPVFNDPEPGTFVLAALGLVPLGFRGLRRMW
jgi:hypothetical protein